jgi:hypothetical protein
MFVLPAMLLSLDKWSTTKAFEEPLVEIFEDPADETDSTEDEDAESLPR